MTEIAITDIKIVIIIDFNSLFNTNYVALYVIRRTVACGNTIRKNKKRQRLGSEVLIRTNSTNLIVTLLNALINTLLTMRTMMVLTQKKSLKKSFIHWLSI